MPQSFNGCNGVVEYSFDGVPLCNVPVYSGHASDGRPYTVVHFKPNAEDLKVMMEGGGFYVKVFAPSLPAICVFTLNEKGEVNE